MKSAYKAGHVTIDNFIAEMFFKRRAEFSKAALPQQFWNLPKYKKLYIIQIVNINRLLERMGSTAMIKAFNDTNACSVMNKEFVALAEKYQAELDLKEKVVEKTPEVESKPPSKSFGKVNRLSEL